MNFPPLRAGRVAGSILLAALSFTAIFADGVSSETVRKETKLQTESFAGNGVDMSTGAFVQTWNVLMLDGGRDLGFNLHYNSRLTDREGALGFGWSHEYEAFVEGDPNGVMTVHWDINRQNSFQFVSEGEPYTPLDEDVQYDTFEAYAIGDAAWRITKMDGTQYEFSSDGKLHRVGNKVKQFLELSYQNGRVNEVEELIAGYRILLVYNDDDKVSAITDSLGREILFSYDDENRLTRVAGPILFASSDVNSSFDNFFVPDNNPEGAFSEIPVDEPGTVGLVKLSTASWVHSRPEDLVVTLVSPQGTRVVIHDKGSSSQANGKILDEFDGELRAGAWRVEAVDTQSGNTGQVFSVRLRFTEATNPINFDYEDAALPAAGRIVSATDLFGNRLYSNTYDNEGRVLTQDDGTDSNALATFVYESADSNSVATFTDRVGEEWIFTHDDACRLLSIEDPLGFVTQYEYDGNGDRTKFIDALGRSTSFTYDSFGNILSMTDPVGSTTTFTYESDKRNVKTITDALGKTTTFKYDGVNRNNVELVTDALGIEDRKSYNGNGQIVGSSMSDGGGIAYTWTGGKMTSATHPGGNGDVHMLYDGVGRLVQVTNPNGSKATTVYSATGNIIRQTDETGKFIASGYDHRNRLITKIDRKGNETSYDYDGNNNLVALTNSLGETRTFEFDGEDRIIRSTDAAGKVTRVFYDAAGRITRQEDGEGNGNTLTYDAVGNVIETRDSNGELIIAMEYDERDLVVSTRDVFGHTNQVAYDEVGRKTEFVDEQGRRTTYTYDALDRLVEVEDPIGRTMSQDYAGDDVVISIKDGKDNTLSLAYDAANRLREISTPSGKDNDFTYNGRDLMKSRATATGKIFQYEYDDAGRLSRIALTGLATGQNRLFFYDDNGNHIRTNSQAVNQSSSTVKLRRTYDALDRLISFENERGEVIGYEYDASGNLAKLIYPEGDAVTYEYDQANRLTTVTDWDNRVTRYEYDSNSQVVSVQHPNGTRRELDYDAAGNIVFRTDLDIRGNPIAIYEYDYDASGQILIEDRSGFDPPYVPDTATMVYDVDNKLTQFNDDAIEYDNDGNIQSTPYLPGEFEYDAYNNLTKAGDFAYTYDEEDHLIEWRTDNKDTLFTVDPRRKAAQIIQKRESDGTLTRYVFGIGLIYEETAGVTKTFHYDHRGSTVALSDDTGSVVGNVAYGPHGNIIERTGDTDTLFLFNGLFGVVSDPQGLNYMRFRWYWPTLKRFISEDAHLGHISVIGSLNRYAYANGDPVSKIDPGGELAWIVAGALTGAATETLITLAVDIADDGKINTPWEEYAGAAIGGAITGGIIAACPTCGAFAGGAGAAAGYLATQGFKGEDVDFVDLAVITATGAIVGRSKAKTAKANPVRRQGIVGIKALVKRSAKEQAKIILKQVAKKAASTLITRYGPDADDVRGYLFPSAGPTPQVGKQAIYVTSTRDVNDGSKGVYGEFIHWGLYQESLSLADRPFPANPNRVMSSF